MSEPTTPPPTDSLLQLFGETTETVDFYGLAIPKLGITIRESKELTKRMNEAIKTMPASSETLAGALELSDEALQALLKEHKVMLARDGDETRSAIYEARLDWVIFCMNRREVKVSGSPMTAELFEDMFPYEALTAFEKLLTPGSSGGGEKGKAPSTG